MRKDLTGKRFGRVVVIGFHQQMKKGQSRFKCKCNCGNKFIAYGSNLSSGNTKSCGCYRIDIFRGNRKNRIKHGMSKTKIYRAWGNMKVRCYNKKKDRYKDYGGRGIKVCATWRKSFQAFYSYVGDPPTSQHQIDRIENDGNYEPGNVRWATPKENSNNTRNAKKYRTRERARLSQAS